MYEQEQPKLYKPYHFHHSIMSTVNQTGKTTGQSRKIYAIGSQGFKAANSCFLAFSAH